MPESLQFAGRRSLDKAGRPFRRKRRESRRSSGRVLKDSTADVADRLLPAVRGFSLLLAAGERLSVLSDGGSPWSAVVDGLGLLSSMGHRQGVEGHRLGASPTRLHQGSPLLGPRVSRWWVS